MRDFEAFVDAPDDFDRKAQELRLIEQLTAIVSAVGKQVPDTGQCLWIASRMAFAPALSEMSAVVRFTGSRRPLVSTVIWRLRPTIFLAPSKPRVPPAAGALID